MDFFPPNAGRRASTTMGMQFEGGEKNNKVVNRKEIDYTNLWPIALAPLIPAAGIALRYVVRRVLKK